MSAMRTLFVLAACLLLAACAAAAQRMQMEREELAIYQSHAGEPVDQVRTFRMHGWQAVADRSLLLETRLNQWYLVDVFGPCQGLQFAHTIGVRAAMNMLRARFDHIVVDGQSCRIESIRPVDARAAREEIRELRRQQ
ncbi:MAG: DUF6491 family protein [Xanthomonadales bacterium]|nr:DUF6491 family protein [Xanthomonadales bacterium]